MPRVVPIELTDSERYTLKSSQGICLDRITMGSLGLTIAPSRARKKVRDHRRLNPWVLSIFPGQTLDLGGFYAYKTMIIKYFYISQGRLIIQLITDG